MAIKMYMWINLSIIGIFQQNTKTIKRVFFFVIQIAIKNIQCRAGAYQALPILNVSIFEDNKLFVVCP